jgi:hypothetical protein
VKSVHDKAVDLNDASIYLIVLLQARFMVTVRVKVWHEIQPIVGLRRFTYDFVGGDFQRSQNELTYSIRSSAQGSLFRFRSVDTAIYCEKQQGENVKSL